MADNLCALSHSTVYLVYSSCDPTSTSHVVDISLYCNAGASDKAIFTIPAVHTASVLILFFDDSYSLQCVAIDYTDRPAF